MGRAYRPFITRAPRWLLVFSAWAVAFPVVLGAFVAFGAVDVENVPDVVRVFCAWAVGLGVAAGLLVLIEAVVQTHPRRDGGDHDAP